MFREISDALAEMVQANRLGPSVAKIWIYQGLCCVIDFDRGGVKFAFNVTPDTAGLVSLDLVQRHYAPNVRIMASQARKEHIARDLVLADALSLIQARALTLFAEIDRQLIAAAASSSDPQRHSRVAPRRVRSGPLKVGVLTLPLHSNVGGNLQAYALMEALRQIGHEPILINRRYTPPDFQEDAVPEDEQDKRLLGRPIEMGRSGPTGFSIAPVSKSFYSTKQLARDIGGFGLDALVVGSDQVWRPRYAKSILPDYFLGFLPDDSHRIRRVSYAASFGTPRWEFSPEQTRIASDLIGQFDAVSVREDSAVALCRRHLGVEARHVLDPTLLLTPDHYARLLPSGRSQPDGNRLLAYILDATDDKARIVDVLSKRLSAEAFTTSGHAFGTTGPTSKSGDTMAERWLASFQSAAFVLTDSFHGAVFSILFNKPFIAYGNPARGMARFTSLMTMFGLEERLVVTSSEIDIDRMLRPIDWEPVNGRLKALRAESFAFLEAALSSGTDVGGGPLTGPGLDSPPALSGQVAPNGASSEPHDNPLGVLCSGCGVCVSESGNTLAMMWSDDGFLVPRSKSGPVPTEAVRVCPFNPRPDKEVKDEDALGKIFLPNASKFDDRAGRFENTYIGFSKMYRPTSSSGGVATYVLAQLLARGDVDHLFVVQSDNGSGYRYKLIDRSEDILQQSKTRYFPVSLDGLFAAIESVHGRVAVSGVPCFIKALRLKQHYHPHLIQKIPFLLGIVCGGLKSRAYTDFLAQSAGVGGLYARPEYRVKDAASSADDYSFSALDAGLQLRTVKMRRLGDMWGTGLFKARACDFCTDVLAELADISLGDAWLPQYRPDGLGNSIVVTRSALADQIIRAGINAGDLVMDEVPVARIVQSQSGGFGHRQDAIKFRAWIAEYFSELPVPVLRPRLLRSISLPGAVLQIQRERTRSKSLRNWSQTRRVGAFMSMMRSSLAGLKAATAARRDDWSRHPLTLFLATRGAAASDSRSTRSSPVLRWLMRKTRQDVFNLNMTRAALLNELAPPRPEKTGDPASSDGPLPSRRINY